MSPSPQRESNSTPPIVHAGLGKFGSITADSPHFCMRAGYGATKKRNPQAGTLRKGGESRSTAFMPCLNLRSVSKSKYSSTLCFGYTLRYLPHLSLVTTYARDQYRVLYTTSEAGVYRVAFYCDIQVQFDENKQVLRVTPLAGIPPVPPKATLNSLTGQGYYRSRSAFEPVGPHTRVKYEVEIKAAMPKRLEWKLIPNAIVTRVVQDVVQRRLQEITDALIARSIRTCPPHEHSLAP